MTRISIEQLVTTPSTLNYLSESAYDHTKWNLGKGIIYNNGGTAVDKYIAPQMTVLRPLEESTPFAAVFLFAINFSTTIDYVFGLENSGAASATRRVHLWSVNKKTGASSWNGFITMTYLTATAHTARDFKIDRKQESTGTVAVSGTAVTGTGTAFATNKVAIGARIGFGSTDPAQITTWYRVTARASDTSITIGVSAGTISAGTAYVIEEYRPVILNTNATTTNGGIHYGKGISIEDFTSGGTTIAVAVSTDDQKAMYWIKDASTQTNIVGAGMALDFAAATPTSLDTYVVDLVSAGNYKYYKYNLRAALTVATGASVSPWILATGNNPFSGSGVQNASVSIATASHGTGSGVKSLYVVTTARVYRIPVTQITTTSITVHSSPADNIIEVPPGGTSTFTVTSAFTTIEYMSDADTFIVGTTHSGGNPSYISQYVASGSQYQNSFGRDYKFWDQSAKDNGHPSMLSNSTTSFTYHDSGGTNLIYAIKQGSTALLNQIYVLAFGADSTYAANTAGYVISPEITTPNVKKYYRAFANHLGVLGSGALRKATEPFDLYIRTTNITTNATSGWNLVDEANDISSYAGAASIQFKIQFRTIGESCLPSRLLGINLSYEDNTTDSHFSLSVEKSSVTSKVFAWYFDTAFGTAVPTLEINLYDANTGGLLLTDDTATPTAGTWEKTTDGTNWTAYNTTDRANNTTWIRYTPTSLADNVKVEAYLQQA
jgi:hypothetical protein